MAKLHTWIAIFNECAVRWKCWNILAGVVVIFYHQLLMLTSSRVRKNLFIDLTFSVYLSVRIKSPFACDGIKRFDIPWNKVAWECKVPLFMSKPILRTIYYQFGHELTFNLTRTVWLLAIRSRQTEQNQVQNNSSNLWPVKANRCDF